MKELEVGPNRDPEHQFSVNRVHQAVMHLVAQHPESRDAVASDFPRSGGVSLTDQDGSKVDPIIGRKLDLTLPFLGDNGLTLDVDYEFRLIDERAGQAAQDGLILEGGDLVQDVMFGENGLMGQVSIDRNIQVEDGVEHTWMQGDYDITQHEVEPGMETGSDWPDGDPIPESENTMLDFLGRIGIHRRFVSSSISNTYYSHEWQHLVRTIHTYWGRSYDTEANLVLAEYLASFSQDA